MHSKKLGALERLIEIMERLRVECPWDREQTFESLRNNTIEETFELVDAITAGDRQEIRKELGDLLLHVVFYSKIGEEEGAFDIADVANGICDKLIYRHPHVFAQTEAETAHEVKQNWEQLKLSERKERRGVLAGVPRSLPALVKAYRIGEKAAAAGFDWKQRRDVWDKVNEELAEVLYEAEDGAAGDGADNHSRTEEEFGDLLFAVVNAARLYGIDPEMALERSNQKFISRFNFLEERVVSQGMKLSEKSLEEMDEIWCEAKRLERGGAKAGQ